MTLILHIVFSFFSTVAFGILTNIPRRALLLCGLTGTAGWLAFYLSQPLGAGVGLANFLGALTVGLMSLFFSRMKKMPMIIFNIPSLVPLVPGGPAYKAIREFVLGNVQAGTENSWLVIVTAGSIAGGFVIISLLENLYSKWLRRHATTK
ncbi:hypothetical protein BAU15_07010 [Enterococcus sp. JM4C]|uniref:threonine/serine exporter family protein n=1 Tax=Candidatus Enterococcus huntleyi TaxID=1857217 RepID=UPI00137B58E4|nr:threonine/serine exporter family protein [Enterococcus sp. JM4C]KAF1297457.1 hypothetical protein BAU15_07010 [Enterococcus sp. JM4C]